MFVGQARIGDTLVARGKRIGGGKSVGFAEAEITSDGRVIARAEGTFKYLGKSVG
jgi:acyl-coenzyme A thioesterase PaaI-like protein